MDYSALGENPQQLIGSNVQLKLRELSAADLKQLLESSPDGTKIHQLITSGIPSPKSATEWENEFGGVAGGTPAGTGSWTLVVKMTAQPEPVAVKEAEPGIEVAPPKKPPVAVSEQLKPLAQINEQQHFFE